MQQPKLRSKVRGTDREIGEVTRIIVDPLSHHISHLVVSVNGRGGPERQIESIHIQSVGDDLVQLRLSSGEVEGLPAFTRDGYVSIHDIEIAHLEDHLHVESGEVLVPLPELERNVPRRNFFAKFTHVIGLFIGLPLAWPVLRYLMKPMYQPFDNGWISIGNANKIKKDDSGVQFKFKRKVKEAYMPEQEIDKNAWVLKATPEVLDKIYHGKDMDFRDEKGRVVWTNKKDVPYVAFSGKCPHLGCGYKWRKHKVLGEVFLCPCHLSIYDAAGKVLDGPAPRPLDPLPIQVTPSGDIKIIDMEFKAGTKTQTRII
ncbi:putative Quinol-cytochrome c reductase, iron-sulfur subunit, modulated with PRC-barrel (modular protein) [Nitrospira tepida]|uniref:Quinol-cytochrome c reductase, iron-sulfur subunit, modulated with PRC-barrel (Modular protein) n=1 Tax=Nitrospira tepida TaxID=2973512 RepID=A0AA86MX87_9BACT|nr:ubiquinol-cytochrome c reductase iron-sulfur subunit [Nitrospira tepida]CAI4030731.1 putative Quinol-cytochrome c reductase, iron-sulfur subunit, modulated with PRC-barrel (modular protein) [Nitrospira tepida]